MSVSRDVHDVATSPPPSFHPTSLLFSFSVPSFPSFSPFFCAIFFFSCPFSFTCFFFCTFLFFSRSFSFSASLPLFTLPLVVPSVLPLFSSSSAPAFLFSGFFLLSTLPLLLPLLLFPLPLCCFPFSDSGFASLPSCLFFFFS